MAKTIAPEGKFKILNVGPTRKWDYQGKPMITYSIQLEGRADWIELNQAEETAAPKAGDELNGHIEQDDAEKYAPRFKKAQNGGGFGGGRGASSPGAIWNAAYATAVAAVNGFLAVTTQEKRDKAGANIDKYMSLVDLVAEKIKDRVDAHTATPAAVTTETAKSESESGESPAPVEVEITDLTEDDINDKDW